MSSASDTQVALPPSRWRLRNDVVLQLFIGSWMAILTPYLGLLVGRPPGTAFRNVWAFVLMATLVVVAALAGWRHVAEGAERRFRALVAVAFAVWAVGELVDALLAHPDAAARLIVRDAVFSVVGVLLCAAGLVESERGMSLAEIRLRRLHRAEVALFALGMFVYLAVLPARLDVRLAASATPSAMLYATIDLLMLGIFAWRRSRARPGPMRARFNLLALAAVLFLTSDTLFLAGSLGAVEVDQFPGLDPVWFLPHLAIAASLRIGGARGVVVASGEAGARAGLPTRRIGPGFLYAALVPVVHLLAESFGTLTDRGPRTQHGFALLLTLSLFALATVHQHLQRRLWESLRREVAARNRRRAAAVKLEAVGRLAAGVAHDFNNLLTVVVGRADLMHSRLAESSAKGEVEAILEIADRATALTGELLAVGEREARARERLEIDAHLAARCEFLAARAGNAIELDCRLGAAGRCVEVDRGHLDRMLDNLVAHAAGAMLRGGRVTLATRHQRLEDAWTRQHDEVVAGDYVVISVRDEGMDMPAEALERIFEPFFATHELRRGAGLGLATVRGLARLNGGQILAHSRPGEGGEIELLFPESR